MSYQFGHVDRDERIDLTAEEPIGEPARWSMVPRPFLTVLVMAGFAGALYFAYVQGTHHPAVTATPAPAQTAAAATPTMVAPATAPPADNIPLIHADPQPMKVKPEQPGGIVVPDRDKLIFSERPGGPPVERLLPPPEQPAPRPAPAPRAAAAVPPPAAAAVAMVPPPATRSSPPRAATPQPAATPRPAPVPAGAIGAGSGGHIRIQLASLRSPDEARSEWQRLKRLNPDLLGKMTADAVRADLGDRGIWYRIEAGSFAQLATAERVCRELKERHLGCSIVR